MNQITPRMTFVTLLEQEYIRALAWVTGNASHPRLSGLVKFYETPYNGVLVEAEVFGLPDVSSEYSSNFYGFHIHENGDCTLPFDKTGNHYNPTNQPHPNHAGDLVPILGNQGYAWSTFFDRRFTIDEIIGKSVIIHAHPDDFTTQPSGNSGEKIGCGVIRAV